MSDAELLIRELEKGPEAPSLCLNLCYMGEADLKKVCAALRATQRYLEEISFDWQDDDDMFQLLEALFSNPEYCCSRVNKVTRASDERLERSAALLVSNYRKCPQFRGLLLHLHEDQVEQLALECEEPDLRRYISEVEAEVVEEHLGTKSERASLKEFTLEETDSGACRAVVARLADCGSLETLDLQSENVEAVASEALVESFKGLHSLRKLAIGCPKDETDAHTIARGLRTLSALDTLAISFLLDEACPLGVIEELRHLPNITDLDLEYGFDSEAMEALGRSLHSLTKLTRLRLGDTEQMAITPEGMTGLCEGLRSSGHLKVLHLSGFKVEDGSAEIFAENLQYLGSGLTSLSLRLDLQSSSCRAIAQNLRHCLLLEELDVPRNDIDDETADALIEAALSLTRLTELSMRSDKLTSKKKGALIKQTLPGGALSHFKKLELDIRITREYLESSPLHFAAATGDVEMIREALAKGADANGLDEYGYTPLHIASRYLQREAIEALVKEGGARLDLKNKNGRTALDICGDIHVHIDGTEDRQEDRQATQALLEELMLTGADERPGEMIKSAAKRFKPL